MNSYYRIRKKKSTLTWNYLKTCRKNSERKQIPSSFGNSRPISSRQSITNSNNLLQNEPTKNNKIALDRK